MLSDLVSRAIESDLFGVDNWFWTDEYLLYYLASQRQTASLAQRLLAGRSYSVAFVGWYDLDPSDTPDFRAPERRGRLANDLSTATGRDCSVSVFHDKGTFQKPDEESGVQGSRSQVVSVFFTDGGRVARAKRAILGILTSAGFPIGALMPSPEELASGDHGQTTLPV